MNKLLCGAALALAVAGCEPAPTITAEDEKTIYTITVVELRGDAPPVVQQTVVSRADELREQAGVGVVQSAISKDTSCVVQDLHLFDQTNFVGDEICFRGAGTATLANFTRTVSPPTTWDSATLSFVAGESPGHFTDHLGNKGLFNAYGSKASTGSIARNSKTVTLGEPVDMAPPLDMF
jgi:hypothetical protein